MRKETGITLFSTGDKSRKSREDPSTFNKKRVEDERVRDARGNGGKGKGRGDSRSIRGSVRVSLSFWSSHDQAGLLQFRGYP